jgi:phage portal protein BeeE
MFGLPPDMLGQTDKQSYAYSETSAKHFILYTLDPKLTERDQELCMKLLTSFEQGRIFIETHVNEALWMLPKDRAEYWWKKFQMGAISADEIRAYDNEAPVPDGHGQKYYVQAQLIPTDQIADFWTGKNANPGSQPTAQRSIAEPVGEKLNGHATIAN